MPMYKIAEPLGNNQEDLVFDGFQWSGERKSLPGWAKHYTSEDNRFWGHVLNVGPYIIRPGSWVLKSQARGDVFGVRGDMFDSVYALVETENEE